MSGIGTFMNNYVRGTNGKITRAYLGSMAEDAWHYIKGSKGSPLALGLLSIGAVDNAMAQADSQFSNQVQVTAEQVQEVKDAVGANRTGFYTTRSAPLDTVSVYRNGDLTIEAGKGFIAFKRIGSDESVLVYDVGEPGADRVITANGPLTSLEVKDLDMTGLGGCGTLPTELDFNSMERGLKGDTPYTTRQVDCVTRDGTVTTFDFDAETITEDGPGALARTQGLYAGMIQLAEDMLGLR